MDKLKNPLNIICKREICRHLQKGLITPNSEKWRQQEKKKKC